MSVNGVGNSIAGQYSAIYSNQAVTSYTKSEEVKSPTKAYRAVRTYQRTDFATPCEKQTYQSNILLDKDIKTTFPMPSSKRITIVKRIANICLTNICK